MDPWIRRSRLEETLNLGEWNIPHSFSGEPAESTVSTVHSFGSQEVYRNSPPTSSFHPQRRPHHSQENEYTPTPQKSKETVFPANGTSVTEALHDLPQECFREAGGIKFLGNVVSTQPSARTVALKGIRRVVEMNPDVRMKHIELQILMNIESIHSYCMACMDGEDRLGDRYRQTYSALDELIRLSDNQYTEILSNFGGVGVLVDFYHWDAAYFSTSEHEMAHRKAFQLLTKLCQYRQDNKHLVINSKGFAAMLCQKLRDADNSDARQTIANLLRCLCRVSDPNSRRILFNSGCVSSLTAAAQKCWRDQAALATILGALWNLSSHNNDTKMDICTMDNFLELLCACLNYHAITVIQNAGSILKNISSIIVTDEEFRGRLRRQDCLQTLVRHLQLYFHEGLQEHPEWHADVDPIVSNACGALWNLSARNYMDQKLLISLGVVDILHELLLKSSDRLIQQCSKGALHNLTRSSRDISRSNSQGSVNNSYHGAPVRMRNEWRYGVNHRSQSVDRLKENGNASGSEVTKLNERKAMRRGPVYQQKQFAKKVAMPQPKWSPQVQPKSKNSEIIEAQINQLMYSSLPDDAPTNFSAQYSERLNENTNGPVSSQSQVVKSSTLDSLRDFCQSSNEDQLRTFCTEGTPSDLLSAATSYLDITFQRNRPKVDEKLNCADVPETQEEEEELEDHVELHETEESSVNHEDESKTDGKKEAKTVKFHEDLVQETPMMFSRCSSCSSLESFEAPSVHSSVISEYSRRTSRAVSPSELPESPSQTMPPSPSLKNSTKFFDEVNLPKISEKPSAKPKGPSPPAQPPPANDRPGLLFQAARQIDVEVDDSPITFATEKSPVNFSSASSLSALTFDNSEQDDQGEQTLMLLKKAVCNQNSAPNVTQSEANDDTKPPNAVEILAKRMVSLSMTFKENQKEPKLAESTDTLKASTQSVDQFRKLSNTTLPNSLDTLLEAHAGNDSEQDTSGIGSSSTNGNGQTVMMAPAPQLCLDVDGDSSDSSDILESQQLKIDGPDEEEEHEGLEQVELRDDLENDAVSSEVTKIIDNFNFRSADEIVESITTEEEEPRGEAEPAALEEDVLSDDSSSSGDEAIGDEMLEKILQSAMPKRAKPERPRIDRLPPERILVGCEDTKPPPHSQALPQPLLPAPSHPSSSQSSSVHMSQHSLSKRNPKNKHGKFIKETFGSKPVANKKPRSPTIHNGQYFFDYGLVDSPKQYAVEGTPISISRHDSLSSLSSCEDGTTPPRRRHHSAKPDSQLRPYQPRSHSENRSYRDRGSSHNRPELKAHVSRRDSPFTVPTSKEEAKQDDDDGTASGVLSSLNSSLSSLNLDKATEEALLQKVIEAGQKAHTSQPFAQLVNQESMVRENPVGASSSPQSSSNATAKLTAASTVPSATKEPPTVTKVFKPKPISPKKDATPKKELAPPKLKSKPKPSTSPTDVEQRKKKEPLKLTPPSRLERKSRTAQISPDSSSQQSLQTVIDATSSSSNLTPPPTVPRSKGPVESPTNETAPKKKEPRRPPPPPRTSSRSKTNQSTSNSHLLAVSAPKLPPRSPVNGLESHRGHLKTSNALNKPALPAKHVQKHRSRTEQRAHSRLKPPPTSKMSSFKSASPRREKMNPVDFLAAKFESQQRAISDENTDEDGDYVELKMTDGTAAEQAYFCHPEQNSFKSTEKR